MKILPTGLGKEALLEAEVELKAYWDRTDPVSRGSLIEHNTNLADFPLQAAFEVTLPLPLWSLIDALTLARYTTAYARQMRGLLHPRRR